MLANATRLAVYSGRVLARLCASDMICNITSTPMGRWSCYFDQSEFDHGA